MINTTKELIEKIDFRINKNDEWIAKKTENITTNYQEFFSCWSDVVYKLTVCNKILQDLRDDIDGCNSIEQAVYYLETGVKFFIAGCIKGDTVPCSANAMYNISCNLKKDVYKELVQFYTSLLTSIPSAPRPMTVKVYDVI